MKFTLIVLSIAVFQVSLCTCKFAKNDKTVAKVSEVRQVDECALCQEALLQLETMLGDLPTEEEFKEALTIFCGLFSETANEECVAFIEEYNEELYAALSANLDPTFACTELELCAAA